MFEIDKPLRKILNEKKGITSNSTKTADYIKFLITDCISVSNPYKAKPMFGNIRYQPFVNYRDAKYDEKRGCIIFEYVFSFPKTPTMKWMSDLSELYITCIVYDSEEDMKKDPAHIGDVQSVCRPDTVNNKTAVYMRFVICFSEDNDYYIGGYTFSNFNDPILVSIIQHEINHVNKRYPFKETDEYKRNYTTLMNIFSEAKRNKNMFEKNLTITIAEMIYRYCVKTEREAFTEQFYKEWANKYSANGGFVTDVIHKKYNTGIPFSDEEREEIAKTTKVYNEYLILKEYLRKNYYNLIQENSSKILYNTFKDIARYFLNLKYKKYENNYIAWCKEFIRQIEYNMELFRKRCLRATHVSDSKNILITEQIEEHMSWRF